jgi:hypothetical protein
VAVGNTGDRFGANSGASGRLKLPTAAPTAAHKAAAAAVFATPGELHVAENNQTVAQIAAMRGLEATDLIKFNLPFLPQLTETAKLYSGTRIWLRGPHRKTFERPLAQSPPRPAPLLPRVPMEKVAARADAELAAMLPARMQSDSDIFLFPPTSEDPFLGEGYPPTGGIEDDEAVAEAMADILDQVCQLCGDIYNIACLFLSSFPPPGYLQEPNAVQSQSQQPAYFQAVAASSCRRGSIPTAVFAVGAIGRGCVERNRSAANFSPCIDSTRWSTVCRRHVLRQCSGS